MDLGRVRIDGKDDVNADLERTLRVGSRNELIADVLRVGRSHETRSSLSGGSFQECEPHQTSTKGGNLSPQATSGVIEARRTA